MKKSRPILFSPVMVKAILEGKKTQTRRVLKWSTEHDGPYNPAYIDAHIKNPGWGEICPHGKRGDILWVREEHYRFGHWRALPGVKTKTGKQKWTFIADTNEVLFDAPESFRKAKNSKDPFTPAWHKRLARFMPRSLCRINLMIRDVSVDKLQNISEKDAKNEGMTFPEGMVYGNNPKDAFRGLWSSINGAESWKENPYVWVIWFKVDV